ncbi:MAG TPA: hypothetical protein VG838_05625 [Opitutaceae bacterium]|nr:hypothetical protein [Opitutaceae bacterium]
MQRRLQPELLDSLPPHHPDAQHSRRDLRLINGVMGNHRWFTRTLPPLLAAGEPVLEVGAGTGELGSRLATRGVTIAGLDVAPRPPDWPGEWNQCDLRAFEGFDRFPVVIGNLIFHQFTSGELVALGATLRRTARLIVACEPQRWRVSQGLFAVVAPLFGANRVTLHDARVSIDAGFLRHELPEIFGLDRKLWEIRCDSTPLGAYRMVAVRR